MPCCSFADEKHLLFQQQRVMVSIGSAYLAICQEQFDRRLVRELVEIDSGQFREIPRRRRGSLDVTQERIDAELRTLAQHQKVLLELDQVLRRIATERGWSRARLMAKILELGQRIKEVERRVQTLLIEAAKDDDL
jgi:ribosome-binding protein aMBF1 (putative translation factor)